MYSLFMSYMEHKHFAWSQCDICVEKKTGERLAVNNVNNEIHLLHTLPKSLAVIGTHPLKDRETDIPVLGWL